MHMFWSKKLLQEVYFKFKFIKVYHDSLKMVVQACPSYLGG
jgi:hypothetical protein